MNRRENRRERPITVSGIWQDSSIGSRLRVCDCQTWYSFAFDSKLLSRRPPVEVLWHSLKAIREILNISLLGLLQRVSGQSQRWNISESPLGCAIKIHHSLTPLLCQTQGQSGGVLAWKEQCEVQIGSCLLLRLCWPSVSLSVKGGR